MSGANRQGRDDAADEEVRQIASELQRYLASHPSAADSLSGIVHWWLERQRVQDQSEMIRRALQYLIHEGAVDKYTLPDGGVVYRAREKE